MPRILRPLSNILALAVLATGIASGHEAIPSDWCPAGASVEIVGQFSYTPAQLEAYRESQMSAEASCTSKTCGIIDQWFWANRLVTGSCGDMGLRLAQPAEAIPFVVGPADYNSQLYHHELYQFDDGLLQGVCAICVSKPITRLDIRSAD